MTRTVTPAEARKLILSGEAPDGLTVGGSLVLTGCTGLAALPSGLTVGGSLVLTGCTGLAALPSGLTVGGSLFLTGCTGLLGKPFRDGTLAVVDGFATLLGGSRRAGDARLHKAWWLRRIAPSRPLPECFVAERGGMFAHGGTPAAALRDLRFKEAQAMFDKDDLLAESRA